MTQLADYLPYMQTDDVLAATEKAKGEARTRLEDQGSAGLAHFLTEVEMTRFLALEQTHRLDSVERHRQWQASLDRTEFYDQLFQA